MIYSIVWIVVARENAFQWPDNTFCCAVVTGCICVCEKQPNISSVSAETRPLGLCFMKVTQCLFWPLSLKCIIWHSLCMRWNFLGCSFSSLCWDFVWMLWKNNSLSIKSHWQYTSAACARAQCAPADQREGFVLPWENTGSGSVFSPPCVLLRFK